MNQTYFVVTLFAFLLIILIVIRYWLNQLEKKSKTSDELIAWLKDLGQRLENSTASVDNKLTKNMDMFNTRLDN
ncbi:hypothetical protein CO083_00545, partial [Candidatus Roizmanbacteria bacterium CG_4_9_14_0_8_um_filter_34_12]